jgi:hypothetical protein
MMEKNRNTFVPYTLTTVPRAGDREIRMRPMSLTIHAKPRKTASKETDHV